ncbi:hypothetical protein L218DRAFT_386345 [Marasmius fiardii PR-910]|nr:hypothetical protein L218DRAFT_386345 [Marasmius fiardii PR-910]
MADFGSSTLRVIDMCDVNMLKQVSSRTVYVSVQSRSLKPTNPFRSRLENQKGSVKIRKKVQSAEIVQFGDRRFTVVTFEPDPEEDAANIRKVLQPLYQAAVSSRQVSLTQIFGVSRSTVAALIYHDELVDGDDILLRYFSYKTPIIFHYLWCRYNPAYWAAVESLENSSISVLDRSYWMFNLRTHSFQYDIPSRALSYAAEVKEDRFMRGFLDDTLFPLMSTSCNPMLNSSEIVSAFPNFMDWVSAVGETAYTRWICGYLPYIPAPVFYCVKSTDSDVDVEFSHSVSPRRPIYK